MKATQSEVTNHGIQHYYFVGGAEKHILSTCQDAHSMYSVNEYTGCSCPAYDSKTSGYPMSLYVMLLPLIMSPPGELVSPAANIKPFSVAIAVGRSSGQD
jgi:hypothetical protein